MVKVLQVLVVTFILVSSAFTKRTDCGPPQCYNPCTNTRPIVDVVFIIDLSSSMSTNIQNVVNGKPPFSLSRRLGSLNFDLFLLRCQTRHKSFDSQVMKKAMQPTRRQWGRGGRAG